MRSSDGSRLGAWRWWLTGCVVLRALLIATEPTDDAHRYLWEGRIQLAGFNPYVHPPDDAALAHLRNASWSKINHPDYPAIYGPIAQLEFLAIAAMYPCTLAAKGFHSLWDVAVVIALAGCLRRMGLPPHGAILYGLCPLVLGAFALEGHLDSLMLVFVMLSTRAVFSRRMMLAGAMLGLAMATKIVAIVLLPWFVLRSWRSAGVALVILAACYVPYFDAGADLFSSLFRFGSTTVFFGPFVPLYVTPLGAGFGRGLVALLLGLALFVLARRRADYVRYAAGAFAALVLVMPVVHYWYLTWVLVLIPFGVRWRWLVAAVGMVLYFEAERQRQMSGVWSMPVWAAVSVWTTFLITWLAEAVCARFIRHREPVPAPDAA